MNRKLKTNLCYHALIACALFIAGCAKPYKAETVKPVKYKENAFNEKFALVNPEFFEMFTFPFKEGDHTSCKYWNNLYLYDVCCIYLRYYRQYSSLEFIFADNRSF